MSLSELTPRPNLEHLKKQARLLQRAFLQGDPAAISRFSEGLVTFAGATPKLADAQHVLAREYGFDNWANLKTHVGSLSDNPVEALTAAIKANDAVLVRKVLARHPILKSQINEPLPNYGFDEPALIAAVHKNNRDMVDALLDAGANINERSRWWAGGFGVLDSSSAELTPYLIERGAYVDIHAAARLGFFDRLKELVDGDPALVHARGGDGQTPLHFASTIEIAEYLLDHGAEIDARDIDHESTAAQYLVWHGHGHPEVARYLITRGAQTAILMAAALGDLELVRNYLDDDPATVRMSVSNKNLPMQNPRSGGSIYLYSFGWFKTPHLLARQFGHEEVFRLLMQRSPLWLRLAQACELGDEALAQELLARHPNWLQSLTPKAGRLILRAAVRNNTQAVRMMLSAGWPAEVYGDNNQTPLHWAAWHGNVEMLRELLRRNPPVEVHEEEHNGTPLTWSVHGSQNSWHRDTGDYSLTLRELLAAGAKVPVGKEDLESTEEVLEVLRQQSSQVSVQDGS